MTKLFEEYEIKRLAKENPQSLIGKQFYWRGFVSTPFTIIQVGDNYVQYEYGYGGTSTNYLSTILDQSIPITE